MPLLRYLAGECSRVLYTGLGCNSCGLNTGLGYNSCSLKIGLDKFLQFASVFWWVGDNLPALEHERVCGTFIGADATADADFSIYDGYFARFVLEFFHLAVFVCYPGYPVLGFG